MTNAKRHNMRSWLSGCLLILGGMGATPALAQSPAVPSDRLGWTQSAGAAEIADLTFGVYVDGSKVALPTATCVAAATTGMYDCVAPFPAMTPGAHTLELVAIRTMGTTVLESAKSVPLAVTFVVVPSAPQSPRVVKS